MLHPTIYMCRCIYRCVFIRRPSGSWARRPHYYNNIIKYNEIEIYSLNFSAPWATISTGFSELPPPKRALEKTIWLERARRARSDGHEPSRVS